MAKTTDQTRKDLLNCNCDDYQKKRSSHKDYNFKVESWLKNKPYRESTRMQKKEKKQKTKCKNARCETDRHQNGHLTNDYINKFDISLSLITKIDDKLNNLERQVYETNKQILKLQERALPKLTKKINKITHKYEYVIKNQKEVQTTGDLESPRNSSKQFLKYDASRLHDQSAFPSKQYLSKLNERSYCNSNNNNNNNRSHRKDQFYEGSQISHKQNSNILREHIENKPESISVNQDYSQYKPESDIVNKDQLYDNRARDQSHDKFINRNKSSSLENYKDLYPRSRSIQSEDISINRNDFEKPPSKEPKSLHRNVPIDNTRYEGVNNLIRERHSIEERDENIVQEYNFKQCNCKATDKEGDSYRYNNNNNDSNNGGTTMHGSIQRQNNVGFQCTNKQCDKFGQCSCQGDAVTDHTIICNMSCEITKLRKDVLDLKVLISNVISLLEDPQRFNNNKPDIQSNKSDDVTWKSQATKSDSDNTQPGSTKKKKKRSCGKKKKNAPSDDTQTIVQQAPAKQKKRCYLSRICKYCCIKF